MKSIITYLIILAIGILAINYLFDSSAYEISLIKSASFEIERAIDQINNH